MILSDGTDTLKLSDEEYERLLKEKPELFKNINVPGELRKNMKQFEQHIGFDDGER